jgi:hypothetical protein
MNCRDFEKVVAGMARGELMDAAAHREGLVHAESCTRCARRLANEQALSAVVAGIVAEDSGCNAPPAGETMLRLAFRKNRRAARARRRAWWTGAAVAAMAALLLVVSVRERRKHDAPQTAQPKLSQAAPGSAPVRVTAPVYRQQRKPRARTLRASRSKPAQPPKVEAALTGREVMTDFLPVVYDPEPIERGHVVRVRLPRASLAVFGLPVNEQHAEEPIKADVLLGEDGLARAVRFVK